MITVHHLENSRSQRVLWLLEELGLPYQLQRYKRDPKTLLAPPELAQVHPLGKSPVLTDSLAGKTRNKDETRAADATRDNRNHDHNPRDTITVAESGAIIEYLLEAHGDGRLRPPAGTAEGRRFTYWLHFAEGSAMPFLLLKLVFDKVGEAQVPFFIKPILKAVAANAGKSFIDPNLQRQLAFMESEIASRPWFAGQEFSAADVQMSYPVEAADARFGSGKGLKDSHPALADWLQRIHARAAYRRALEVGGPYSVVP